MQLALILFAAGVLTILLPCILPLIPIVLGVSISGRSKLRPLLTIAGMLVSFVGFTFLLLVVLREFVELADYIRIGTYYVLLLFGLGFFTHNKHIHLIGALLGAFFFLSKGWVPVVVAAVVGILLMEIGGRVATAIQGVGTKVQSKTVEGLGDENPMTAFILGLTMGMVWVPCAGPALGFAFTLVREEPGLQAFGYLTAYGAGSALPLLLVGYGGQAAVKAVRGFTKYSGTIKKISGLILIATAVAFQLHLFTALETWFVQSTPFGTIGTQLEEKIFNTMLTQDEKETGTPSTSTPNSMTLPKLPKIIRAPELSGLGPWHNSDPLTMEGLKGKVVLVDFWTYSCINCIRTIPYLKQYAEKYQDKPFVLLGVHTPEFIFEKSEKNVSDASKRLGVTWPVAQDNDFETWRAFSNRYWPAKYLIDADGYVRYTHFGEGAYDETDQAIMSLLNEIGAMDPDQTSVVEDQEKKNFGSRSPETYLGQRSWSALGNGSLLPTSESVTYEVPETLKLHHYYLKGDWQMVNDERQALLSNDGSIFMKFEGAEINLVLGMEEGAEPATVTIELDGEFIQQFEVDAVDLYNLWTGERGEHEISIYISGAGFEGYAFTFGS